MTDRTQFEAMLEALINEDQETAKEIFHNIVVAKSREIYEELLESEFMESEEDNEEEKNEAVDDEEDKEENPFGADDSEEDDAEADDADSEEDDMDADSEEDPFGGEEEGEEGEGDMEDRVMDLEDALDELKAEFEQLMADEEGEEHMGGDDMGMDAMGGDDLEMEDEVDPTMIAEYTKKVGLPKHGDNGANARSIVAKPNRMGGTSANIAKSFSTEKGGTEGGLASPKAGDLTSGLGKIHNRKDSNAGKTAFKKSEPGHGAEKKGKGEVGGVDKKSLIGGRN